MQYLGGKARLAKRFAHILDAALVEKGGRFAEPFVGGFNLVRNLENVREATCSDIHAGLINMYNELKRGWVPPSSITEEQYKKLKAAKGLDPLSVFASFACAFAGIEWGSYERSGDTNFAAVGRRSLLRKKEYMEQVEFQSCSYTQLLLEEPSVVYCDPPYANTTKYKTGDFDHKGFYQWCEDLVRDGHAVFVSEFSAPEYWEVVWEIERKIKINPTKNHKRIDKLYKVCAK